MTNKDLIQQAYGCFKNNDLSSLPLIKSTFDNPLGYKDLNQIAHSFIVNMYISINDELAKYDTPTKLNIEMKMHAGLMRGKFIDDQISATCHFDEKGTIDSFTSHGGRLNVDFKHVEEHINQWLAQEAASKDAY